MKSAEWDTPRDELQNEQTLDLLRVYLNDMGRIPMINAEREVELAQTMEAGLLAGQVLRVRRGERDSLLAELHTSYSAHDGKNHKPLCADPKEAAETACMYIEKLAVREDIYDEELNELSRQGTEAFEKLLTANLRLVVSMATKNARRGLDLTDVIQFGNLGLFRAVQKFDYAKGYKFSTYATGWIHQSISAGIADTGRAIRLPLHLYEAVVSVRSAQRRQSVALGREPSLLEIAQDEAILKKKYSSEKIAELLEVGYSLPSYDMLADEESPGKLVLEPSSIAYDTAEEALFNVESEKIAQALGRLLTETEISMVFARFGIFQDQQGPMEIGSRFGLSDSAVRRTLANVIRRLVSDDAFLNEFGPQEREA